MRIYLDLDSRRLLTTPTRPLSLLEFKRRDNDSIELQFLRDSVVQQLPAGTTARVGIKPDGDYDAPFLAVTTLTQSGTGTATVYIGELNLNTTALATAFAAEQVTLPAMLEVEWVTGDVVSSSKTLPTTIHNDVIRGDEGAPATLPIFYSAATSDFKATQAQAEAGTDNATWMTPLRTKQAIVALSGGGTPSAHASTHATGGSDPITPSSIGAATAAQGVKADSALQSGAAISSISGLQTALDGKQAAGNYAPATGISPSAISGTAVITTDARLSDARQPLTHTHSAADVTSGTLALAHLPTGTTSTTVALGNHTHPGMLTATGGITTIAVVSSMPATPDASTLYIVTA